MDFGYSPSRGAGGTCHLSPSSHLRHVDSVSSIRTLRRSLSRSPSRHHLLQASSKSRSASPKSPASPTSPRFTSPLKTVSLLIGSPFPPSSSPTDSSTNSGPTSFGLQSTGVRKAARPALRRTTPLRNLTGGTKPFTMSSPVRRGLSEASDNGNAFSISEGQVQSKTSPTFGEKENCPPPSSSPISHTPGGLPPAFDDLPSKRHSSLEDPDISNALRDWQPAKSSPLKRSDGVMNLDKAQFGSPSHKRRTICISSMTSPFQPREDVTVDWMSNSISDEEGSSDETATSFRSRLAPKLASLRRSAFYQRSLDKTNINRARRSADFAAPPTPTIRIRGGAGPSKARNRVSSDPSTKRSDPGKDAFQFEANLAGESTRTPFLRPARPNPHPLSKALSPSSPTPPAAPARPPTEEQPPKSLFGSPSIPPINFSKSLPIGALRPQLKAISTTKHQEFFPTSSSDGSFATPEAYKMARPDPAAFRSTGLISKRHRNPEDLPPPPAGPPGMPDTPCKKMPLDFTFSSSPASALKTIAQPRFAQPEFGTPSRPLGVTQQQYPQFNGTPALSFQIPSAFGGSFQVPDSMRRASLVSVDGDELVHLEKADSQSSADELPPTPTKQASGPANPKPNSLRSRLLGRGPSIPEAFMIQQDFAAPAEPVNDASVGSSTSPSTVSARKSPQTPADSLLPDPSSLSILPKARHDISPSLHPTMTTPWNKPPETPTAHRESNALAFMQNINVTPSNHVSLWGGADVDPSLNSRFKKSEWYARGEFSDVYKVYQPAEGMEGISYFSSSFSSIRRSTTPLPDRVWVVKKSKLPYSGLRLRERKLREVSILKALGRHDHVVSHVDDWEATGHLYIQMEFCEGGSLETFLARTGNKGRLDDFRIWKILIELSLGVQHIHHSGFLHLDLKPANVFITFEGTLKIGDFGLATEFPAPAHIEGEGDRRYMGPDLLQGSTDKPADIFALGMMMFEIGGNLELPDNGASWQKLRSGDWSGLPSLTSGSTHSVFPDSRNSLAAGRSFGEIVEHDVKSHESLYPDSGCVIGSRSSEDLDMTAGSWKDVSLSVADKTSHTQTAVGGDDMAQAPRFMIDPEDEQALDKLVHWMMLPAASERPNIDQVLASGGVQWVDSRRRAGATIFEGNWGPPNHVLKTELESEDQEMLDA